MGGPRARHSRKTALSAEGRLVYADSSALVKLIIEEPESGALERHLEGEHMLVTSRIALVEVGRATALAKESAEVEEETDRLLASCTLVAVSAPLLRAARQHTSLRLRTLDAIHLASALRVEPDELLTYDERLLKAAAGQGLRVASPGGARR